MKSLMDQAQGSMGSHPLGRKRPIQEEHDACKGRQLFKRDMMLVKGGTCSGNDVTIPKGCLYKASPPLIVKTHMC